MTRSRLSMLALVALCATLVWVQVLVLSASGWDVPQLLYYESLVTLYFVAGLIALWRQPHNPFATLLLIAGLGNWCAALATVEVLQLSVIGALTSALPLALLIHTILAFPNGRLAGRLARTSVVAGYLTSTVLQVPRMLLSPQSPLHVSGLGSPDQLVALITGQRLVGLGCLVLAMVALWWRWFADRGRPGRLTPFVAYGFGCLVAMSLTQISRLLAAWSVSVPDVVQVFPPLQAVLAAILPVVFLVGVLTGSFGRTGELREFLDAVGGRPVSGAELDAAVARAVGLPGCWIAYAAEEPGHYVAADGSPARLPGPGEALHPIRDHGRLVGAIGHPAGPDVDARTVHAVAEASVLVIGHQQAQASLHAALLDLRRTEEALRQSRRRIASAGDRERRRIARDLHDGLQQNALTLGLRAQRLAVQTDPAALSSSATALRDGLLDLLAELRNLVQGIMPAPLVERGVDSAVRAMAGQSGLAVLVESTGEPRRLPAEIESTLYFCVLEAVTNAGKYARAESIRVRLSWAADRVVATVRDDGVGGAAFGSGAGSGGTGLLGLRDRLAAFGGTVTVDSAPGAGTTVGIEVPCG